MLVTDCRLSAPPVITGKGLNAAAFTHGEISLTFDNHVLDNDRCFLVDVTDPDADREADNYSEFIKLKIIPMNFKPTEGTDLQSLLPVPDFGYIIGGRQGTRRNRIQNMFVCVSILHRWPVPAWHHCLRRCVCVAFDGYT
ncbi:MAG: hypothetical protein WDO15_25990 [Bacteroidota bacterium]